MMISPGSYRMQHRFDSTLKLKAERMRLEFAIKKCEKELEDLENGTATRIVCPSPKVRIGMYKEYLEVVDDLISKRKKFSIFRKRK